MKNAFSANLPRQTPRQAADYRSPVTALASPRADARPGAQVETEHERPVAPPPLPAPAQEPISHRAWLDALGELEGQVHAALALRTRGALPAPPQPRRGASAPVRQVASTSSYAKQQLLDELAEIELVWARGPLRA